jgi:hypothetical protein
MELLIGLGILFLIAHALDLEGAARAARYKRNL